jgi:hypothetical protein
MLFRLDHQIRQAYEHAEDCARRAKNARNPEERRDWLFVEQRWLTLARSLEFTRRAELFAGEADGRRGH